MANDQSQNPYTSGQQGSGSAEDRGDNRQSQKQQLTNLDKEQRKDIAAEAGLGRERLADINELGGMSGRDDYAGGSGDEMEEQKTDDRTDR